MSDKFAVRYVVVGRVQGVGFRDYTRKQANRYGVKGQVRNLPDGNVEIIAVFESPEQQRTFEKKIQEGPRLSRVLRMEKTDLTGTEVLLYENQEEFEITY
ncbi:MAG: acylphosphatase [Candidatus Hydrogenedentota bacterium]|nr:MAG: acylphosphatase [Candidatus Hydrogenedentota bacterium]